MRMSGLGLILSVILGSMNVSAWAAQKEAETMWVYVGSTGGEKSKGISVLRMDPATGKLSEPEIAAEAKRASFVAIHPSGKFLYATREMDGMGAVESFNIDRATGKLSAINSKSSGGKGACFVGVDAHGKNALVANYGAGSAGVIQIGADGKLGELSQKLEWTGSSVNAKRQTGAHAHSINVAPGNDFVFVCDLGSDKVFRYAFDPTVGKLTEQQSYPIEPGSGPRHMTFMSDGRFAYVINELSNTVTAFAYSATIGELTQIQTISTLPSDFKGESYCSEVLVHPSGKFVYGANRGHDSIAVFSIDQGNGKLSSRGQVSCGGKWPRNFGIDPSGKWLIVANEHSDSLVVFAIDQSSGALTANGSTASVVSPSCVRFLK